MAERKAHVVRLFKDDDTSSDTWIDIERLDELFFKSARGYQYRQKRWKFVWDDFHADGKKVVTKKIVDPNDEENFIEVPIRSSVFVQEASGSQFQGRKHKFVNGASNRRRRTKSRRVYHHDIADEDMEGGQPPSDPDDYLASLKDQDIDQYVDVELLDKYWSYENEKNDAQGRLKKKGNWQEKKWLPNPKDKDVLLKDPILDTDEADPEFVPTYNPEDGPKVDPPYRLDPLQNIVNVSWGGGLAVEFGDKAEDAPSHGDAPPP